MSQKTNSKDSRTVRTLRGIVLLAALGVASSSLAQVPAVHQEVAVDPDAQVVSPFATVGFEVRYATDPPTDRMTGLGVRMHWNSETLSFSGLSEVLSEGNVIVGAPEPDLMDLDGDPLTDMFLHLAWYDVAGRWPNRARETLYRTSFDTLAPLTSPTHVRFSASSTGGFNFRPTPGEVDIKAMSDLVMTKTVGSETRAPGLDLGYVVTIRNDGPDDVLGALVEDVFPEAFVAVDWECVATGGASCTNAVGTDDINELVDLTNGSTVTFTTTGDLAVDASGSLTNFAAVTPPDDALDTNLANNVASASTTIDATPPTVSRVRTVAATLDDELVPGEKTNVGITQLVVEFSEGVDPTDATDAANYQLLSIDPMFPPGGLVCGNNPDQVLIEPILYDEASRSVILAVNGGGGFALPASGYALLVCGSNTIHDLAGNPFDGNADGVGGDDFVLGFESLTSNLLINPNFDIALDGWTIADSNPAIEPDVLDVNAALASGSVRIASSGLLSQSVHQCVLPGVDEAYSYGGFARVASGDADGPVVSMEVDFFSDGDCSGIPMATDRSTSVTGDTVGAWTPFSGLASVPPGAASARVSFVVNSGPTGAAAVFAVRGDSLFFSLSDLGSRVPNGTFDEDLSGWTLASPSPAEITHSNDDEDASPDSGSALITNTTGNNQIFFLEQCVPFQPLAVESYSFGASVRIESGRGNAPSAEARARLFETSDCSGTTSENVRTDLVRGDTATDWAPLRGNVAPGNAQSVLLSVTLRARASSDFVANIDNVFFTPVDADADGIANTRDNCPGVANADQADADRDGIGNACDDDDDGDRMPDAFEIANGFNPMSRTDADGDADGDGYTNLHEYEAGTSPMNPLSMPSEPDEPFVVGFGSQGLLTSKLGITGAEDSLHVDWSDYNAARGEARPALCNLDDDAGWEIVVGLGKYPSHGGRLQVLDDVANGYAPIGWLRVEFPDYNEKNGETFPVCGDLDADGRDEVAVGLGKGGGGLVMVFDDALANFEPLAGTPLGGGWIRSSWDKYNRRRGEIHPAIGNLDDDPEAELVLGLGAGGAGRLLVLDDLSHAFAPLESAGKDGWLRVKRRKSNGGTWPAIGDLGAGPRGELVVGLDRGGRGWVYILESNTFAPVADIRIDDARYARRVGIARPVLGDADGDGLNEILLGLGADPGGNRRVVAYEGLDSDLALIGWVEFEPPEKLKKSDPGAWPAIGRGEGEN